mmetsp:Transcript_18759/g.27803  ORF Transcript_18759/g.27803 Transcript_18759/m.27803 type:complete len:426 (-) Transcript_18759:364-1641(-)
MRDERHKQLSTQFNRSTTMAVSNNIERMLDEVIHIGDPSAINWTDFEKEMRANPDHLRNYSNQSSGTGTALHCLCRIGCPTSTLTEALQIFPEDTLLAPGGFTGNMPLHYACRGPSALAETTPACIDNIRVLLEHCPEAAKGGRPIGVYLRSYFPKLEGVRLFAEADLAACSLDDSCLDTACSNVSSSFFSSGPGGVLVETYIRLRLPEEELSEAKEEGWKILEYLALLRANGRCNPRVFASLSTSPLHAVMTNYCYESLANHRILQPFIQRNLRFILHRDYLGNTPLHILCQSSLSTVKGQLVKGTYTAVREFVTAAPRVASIPNGDGTLPLYAILKSGCAWGFVMKQVLNAAPVALRTRDKRTRLYPFMEAGIGEASNLDTIYSLLKKNTTLAKGLMKNKKRKRNKIDDDEYRDFKVQNSNVA